MSTFPHRLKIVMVVGAGLGSAAGQAVVYLELPSELPPAQEKIAPANLPAEAPPGLSIAHATGAASPMRFVTHPGREPRW